MFKVNSCCCGCSLRKGSVAIMTIVFSLQIIVFVGLSLVMMDVTEEETPSSEDSDEENDDFNDEVIEAALFSMYFTGAGFYGIIKEKPQKMVKYLMIQLVYLVLITGVTIWLIVAPSMILEFLKLEKWCQIPLAITFFLLFCIFSYFFIVVFSYYRELKRSYPKHVSTAADIPLRAV